MTTPWLTLKEAADYLRLVPEVLARHFRLGHIKAKKIGKEWRTRAEWLDAAGVVNTR